MKNVWQICTTCFLVFWEVGKKIKTFFIYIAGKIVHFPKEGAVYGDFHVTVYLAGTCTTTRKTDLFFMYRTAMQQCHSKQMNCKVVRVLKKNPALYFKCTDQKQFPWLAFAILFNGYKKWVPIFAPILDHNQVKI